MDLNELILKGMKYHWKSDFGVIKILFRNRNFGNAHFELQRMISDKDGTFRKYLHVSERGFRQIAIPLA